MGKNAYIVKAYPNGIDRWDEFQSLGIIAVGWPDLGNLSTFKKDEIRELLLNNGYEDKTVGKDVSKIWRFCFEIQKSDYVIVPHNDVIIIGVVDSGYTYDENAVSMGYPHQHKVKWLSKIPFNTVSGELSKRLTLPSVIIGVSDYVEEIDRVIDKYRLNYGTL